MKKYVTLALIVLSLIAEAQIPEIESVERPIFFPQGKITISGTGFSNDPNQLDVFFGAEKGRIVSSTTNLIEVRVPLGAHADNITVINKASGKMGKSPMKFFPAFSGVSGFDPARVSAAQEIQNSQLYFDVCACDINGDNFVDMVATRFTAASTSIDIFINDNAVTQPGNISFKAPYTVSVPSPTAYVSCGDLNGDGFPDLVATEGGPGGRERDQIYVMTNNGTAITGYKTLSLPTGLIKTNEIVTRDLNFDGLPEIVVANEETNDLYIYRNVSTTAGIGFSPDYITFKVEGLNNFKTIDVQDLNSDNRPEIILGGLNSNNRNEIWVFPNTSTQDAVKFGTPDPSLISISSQAYLFEDLITGDFNRDGLLDIAATSNAQNYVSVWINSSTTNALGFSAPNLTATSGAQGMDVGDVDGDGFLDLIVGNLTNTAPGFTVLNNKGGTAFDPVYVPGDNRIRNITVNDFDRDGKPDFVMTAQGSTSSEFFIEVRRNQNCFLPRIIGEDTRSICPGQSFEVATIPSPGSSYEWKLDGTTFSTTTTPFATVTAPGLLTVVAVQEGGTCNLESNTVTFINASGAIPTDPVAGNNGPVCVGEMLQLTATTVAGATYEWTGPNAFTSTDQNPIISDIQSTSAGEYCVTVTLGDCQSSQACTLVEAISMPSYVISFSGGEGFCEGNTATVSVPNDPAYSYVWTKDGTQVGTTAALDITGVGTYGVTVQNIAYGCELVVDPISIEAIQPPAGTLETNITACAGEPIIFGVDITSQDPNYDVSYLWNFGDGTTSTEANPEKIYSVALSYNVSVNISYAGVNNCGSDYAASVTITDAVVPTISADIDPICPGEEATLTVAGTYQSITWDDGTTGSTRIVTQPGIEYFAETLDANGCPGKALFTLQSKTVPVITTTFTDTLIDVGASVQMFASGGESYEWFPPEELDDAFISNPTATPSTNTRYGVIGTSVDACSDTAYVQVNLDFSGGIDITIFPSAAFSPNGDLIDDNWVIKGINNYPTNTVTIFDRRGRLVTELENYSNDGNFWDGTMNGKEIPAGTYYYIIKGPDENYNPVKGSILVVK